MEIIIGFILLYVAWGVIEFIVEKVGEWNEDRKKSIRDEIAHNLLSDDFINSLNNYKKKFGEIGYYDKPNGFDYLTQEKIRLAQSYINETTRPCPQCETGRMMQRKGRFGKFYGCSNFPKCDYTKDFKTIELEHKKEIEESFLSDFKKAYK